MICPEKAASNMAASTMGLQSLLSDVESEIAHDFSDGYSLLDGTGSRNSRKTRWYHMQPCWPNNFLFHNLLHLLLILIIIGLSMNLVHNHTDAQESCIRKQSVYCQWNLIDVRSVRKAAGELTLGEQLLRLMSLTTIIKPGDSTVRSKIIHPTKDRRTRT